MYANEYAGDFAGDLGGDLVDTVRSVSGLRPVQVFGHAPIEREAEVRSRFDRVHVCRRFEKDLLPAARAG